MVQPPTRKPYWEGLWRQTPPQAQLGRGGIFCAHLGRPDLIGRTVFRRPGQGGRGRGGWKNEVKFIEFLWVSHLQRCASQIGSCSSILGKILSKTWKKILPCHFMRLQKKQELHYLGGGFKYFLILPVLGEMIQVDEHIFQMGWFNHQLVVNHINYISIYIYIHGCFQNNGTPKSSILIGFSIIFTIHFGVPLFLETSIWHRYLLQDHLNQVFVGNTFLWKNKHPDRRTGSWNLQLHRAGLESPIVHENGVRRFFFWGRKSSEAQDGGKCEATSWLLFVMTLLQI